MSKEPVTVDPVNGILYVPHTGYTLRVLLAAAASTGIDRRVWKISYKGIIIGSIRIRNE